MDTDKMVALTNEIIIKAKEIEQICDESCTIDCPLATSAPTNDGSSVCKCVLLSNIAKWNLLNE